MITDKKHVSVALLYQNHNELGSWLLMEDDLMLVVGLRPYFPLLGPIPFLQSVAANRYPE